MCWSSVGVSGLVCKAVQLMHGLKEGLAVWSGMLSGTHVMMMASASHRHRECFLVSSSGIFLHVGCGCLAVPGGARPPGPGSTGGWPHLSRARFSKFSIPGNRLLLIKNKVFYPGRFYPGTGFRYPGTPHPRGHSFRWQLRAPRCLGGGPGRNLLPVLEEPDDDHGYAPQEQPPHNNRHCIPNDTCTSPVIQTHTQLLPPR